MKNSSRKIYSKNCWIDHSLQPATITLADGRIAAIDFSKLDDSEDMGDFVIMPGVIDAHVHVNEPGRTEWEGFDTATKAAAAGGTTTLVDMPLNASPVTVSLQAFQEKLHSTEGKMHINCAFYGGLIPGNVSEIEGMIKAGVVGVKCFLVHSGIDDFPNVTQKDIEEAMPILAKYNIPLLVHAEIMNEAVSSDFENHPQSYQHYLASRPKKWENDALEMMAALSAKYNCAVHIVHVSSAEALDIIERAKAQKTLMTAETCPQYIFFHAEEIPDGNCLYKCAPPIREKENNELLKQALKIGLLDFVSTDHSPAPFNIKQLDSGNLMKAWGGIAGIQFLLSASWTALKDIMPLETFIPLLTAHPAQFIHAQNRKGTIAVGFDADLVCWNPHEKFIVKEESIQFRHKISPYIGTTLFGAVHETIVNGHIVFSNQEIKQLNKGKWLLQV